MMKTFCFIIDINTFDKAENIEIFQNPEKILEAGDKLFIHISEQYQITSLSTAYDERCKKSSDK